MRPFILRPFVFVVLAVVSLTVNNVASAVTSGNKTGQACYKGAYAHYQDPSTGRPFASQDACVSFAAKGGTLTPEVDISLAFNTSSASAGTLAVHNGDLVSVTVTIVGNFSGGSREVTTDSAECRYDYDQAGDPARASCTAIVGAGQTVNFFDMGVTGGASASGTASVGSVSPSYPDPNTTNNLVGWSLSSSS